MRVGTAAGIVLAINGNIGTFARMTLLGGVPFRGDLTNLFGARYLVGNMVNDAGVGLQKSLEALFLCFLLRTFLRREWRAGIAFVLFCVVLEGRLGANLRESLAARGNSDSSHGGTWPPKEPRI